MLDELPNYTTEPDWMLQSSQISDSALICVLVKEFYPGISRLVALLLLDREQYDQVISETINWAVLNRHRFWGSTSLRVWLYGHVYKTCRRINRPRGAASLSARKKPPALLTRLSHTPPAGIDDLVVQALFRLSEKQRSLIMLECLEELTPEEITQVIGGRERPAWVWQRLLNTHALLVNRMGREQIPELELKKTLKWMIQETAPLKPLNGEEEAALCNRIEAQIAARWQRRRFAIGSKELAIGGLVAVLVLGLGLATNLLAPASEPARVERNLAATAAANNGVFVTPPSSAFGVFFLSTDFPSSEMFTPTPLPPRAPQEPLSTNSSLKEIQNRMEQSDYYWSTLYAEAIILDYGPLGYVGPPQTYRNRLWFSQPSHMMVLAGRPDQNPDYARIVIDNNFFEEDMSTGVAYYPKSIDLINSPRASSIILSYALNYSDRNRLYGFYLTDLLFPFNAISNASQIQVIGHDSFNGRSVLVLRWIRAKQKEQVWVDAITGLILGWRVFEAPNSEIAARDVFISSLVFDVNLPTGLYSYRPTTSDKASWQDLWTPTQTVDILQTEADILKLSVGRVAVPVVPAPPGLDPSNACITFQWHSLQDGSLGSDVSLITGNYYLGTVNMGDPWSLLCIRSPDGGTIAYIKRPDIPIYAPETVQWFRLQDPSKVYDLFPNGYTASDVAFSPDGEQLAFFGCSRVESNCGVYLLNLQNQQRRKLINIATGAYFAWNPEGDELALLGSDDLGSLRVFVLKIANGEVIYTGPIDWQTFQTGPDSPTRSWGVPFPAYLSGLEVCVTRPIP